MRSWFPKPLERWKSRNMKLACPACQHWASDDVFRRGRFMLGEENLTCDRPCGKTNSLTAWRIHGLAKDQMEKLHEEMNAMQAN